jgi:uncharacterized protein YyaL (SSP411 family)
LLRRFRAGEAAIPGFLDDYTMLAQALIDLYEAQFDPLHLDHAIELTGRMIERFEDTRHGGFFSSPQGDSSLLLRMKEDYDGAEPSGNSVAILNLLRLAQIANRPAFRESAERALAAFESRLQTVQAALPQMLAACEFLFSEPRQIIIAGERDGADTRALVDVLHSKFVPNRVALLVDSAETRRRLAAGIPAIASMESVNGRASAYVCRDYTCQLPVFEPDKLAELLQ